MVDLETFTVQLRIIYAEQLLFTQNIRSIYAVFTQCVPQLLQHLPVCVKYA